MFVALIAIVLLLACVGAIYFLLRNMGQEGIEVAAPTSCKSGRCGVRRGEGDNASCREQGVAPAGDTDAAEIAPEKVPPLAPEPRIDRRA